MTRRWILTTMVAVLSMTALADASANVEHAGEIAADGRNPATLDDLARVFGEPPMKFTALGQSLASCGAEGHCSYTDCIVPECPPGETGVCNCVNSEDTCDDAHNPWNPWDDDTHAIFNCKCGCDDGEPGPPECRVYDPLDPERCLLPGSNDQ